VDRIAGLFVLRPADWEQLRHEEGSAGHGIPYWARPWPSGTALAARAPFDLVLAADVLYLQANVRLTLALLPRLGDTVLIADPGRAGARDFLAAARATFTLRTTHAGEIAIHRLTRSVA
jgi:predicted nicotinamide N-methyase